MKTFAVSAVLAAVTFAKRSKYIDPDFPGHRASENRAPPRINKPLEAV